MNEVRLPLAGSPTDGLLPSLRDELRARFPRPSIAVVDARDVDGGGAFELVRRVAERRGLDVGALKVRARSRAGAEQQGDRLFGSVDVLPRAIDEACARMPSAVGCLVFGGAAVVALRRPDVSVFVTHGIPTTDLGADLRSVIYRCELIVPSLDDGLVDALLARLTGH